jgi:hypothetical protein
MSCIPKDLTGNRYGRLVAVAREEISPNKDYFWKCLCDCGKTTKVTIGSLNSGHTNSCGCLQKESRSIVNTTHNMSKTKEYKSWVKMRERCPVLTDQDYQNYGAIGITVQDSWINDFSAFISYIGKHPKDGQKYSIDRVENTKGYEEGNVRWATQNQQARNKTKHISNTSGMNGVVWDNKVHPNGVDKTLYCNAVCSRLNDSKQTKRCFSVKVFGLLPAFAMACEYRKKMIIELNEQGAGYSVNHGL